MKKNMRNNKMKKQMLASGLALAMLSTGTFAWQSFSQIATNEIINKVDTPGARLHDYFNGTNKDVFVENYASGEDAPDVYARVRLSEYFEYGKGAGTVDASNPTIVRGDIENATTPKIGDQDSWDVYLYGTDVDPDEESIRTFRDLVLGGETVYLPTFNQDNTDLTGEVNGTFAGTDGDGAENAASRYDNYVEYTENVEYPGTIVSNTATNGNAVNHTAKMTQDATVTTMDQWILDDMPIGDIWVFDETGWAYYANPIPGGEASGLLLDAISIESNPSDEWYYAIEVTAELATLGDWGDKPEDATDDGTGMYVDMTENSMELLTLVSSHDSKILGGPEVEYTVEEFTVSGPEGELNDGDTFTLAMGESLVLTAEVTTDDGGTPSKIQGIEWTIAQSGLRIKDALMEASFINGVFKPVSSMAGNAYILTATSKYDTDFTLSIEVTVAGVNVDATLDLTNRFIYSEMDSETQAMYEELALGLFYGEEYIFVSDNEIDMDTFVLLASSVTSDFSEMFWIPLGWNGNLALGLMMPMYTVDYEDIPAMQAEIDQVEADYIAALPGDLTNYQIVEFTYRYVSDHVDYVFADHNQTIYGAMVEQEAVCAGYAKMFKYLTRRQGIETAYITGIGYTASGSEAHGWNMVVEEDEYYYVDTTWADGYGIDGVYNYYYLMQSYDKMQNSHVDDVMYKLDKTKFGTTYNYAVQNNLIFNSYDATAITDAWKAMYTDGMGQFDMEFTSIEAYIEAYADINAIANGIAQIIYDNTGKLIATVNLMPAAQWCISIMPVYSEATTYSLNSTVEVKMGMQSRFH